MGTRIWGLIRLLRPPNLPTAVADILAGSAIVGLWSDWQGLHQILAHIPAGLPWLVLSTICLYGGGVALNDYFDAELDAHERPERPIPSGVVSRRLAGVWSAIWLLMGVLAAIQVSLLSGLVALVVVILVISYDAWTKHKDWLGPINMGLCRGANLCLGMSLVPLALWHWAPLALLPILYITAITLISRGEVAGGDRSNITAALSIYVVVAIVLIALISSYSDRVVAGILFVVFFVLLILPPLMKARRTLAALDVRSAVKAGVLALIPLNACLAAAFAHWTLALGVLLLLPISFALGKWFAVT